MALLLGGELPYAEGPMPVTAEWFSDDAADNAERARDLADFAFRPKLKGAGRSALDEVNRLDLFLTRVAAPVSGAAGVHR